MAFRPLPGLIALVLAVAGAFGLAPKLASRPPTVASVVDRSRSCQRPEPMPAGALLAKEGELEARLQEAAAIPGIERIHLYTDAVLPGPPALPDLPVDVVLMERRDDAGILDLRTPPRVAAGADFPVEIEVGRSAGPRRQPMVVAVRLLREGRRVGSDRQLRLERGQRRTVRIRDRVDSEGLVRYQAVLESPLGEPANDRREALVRIGDRPALLAVGPRQVAETEFEVVAKRPEEVAEYLSRPGILGELDVILLSGPVPPPAAQERLVEAVRAGAGLLVLGGAGYGGGALEQILPLTDSPPSGRAALLLLDFSGSMEKLHEALIRAVERLRRTLAPTDKVAFVAFRDEVVAEAGWQAASGASWNLRSIRPSGNTYLVKALKRAQALLAGAGEAQQRLFVVSDGKWLDIDDPQLRALLPPVYRAALFVGSEVPEKARTLFPVSFVGSGEDLEEALARLEEQAPDRFVKGGVDARKGPTPRWLRGVPLPSGRLERPFPRLYGRNKGEAVVLLAPNAGIPIIGALVPGGRVVVSAAEVAPEALLRACVRPGRGVRLRGRRVGEGLHVEAQAPTG
ncbi:MAG: VWA domain-containing protein, partial [Planctomycetota bacterium]